MTKKKRTMVAAAASVGLVAIARALLLIKGDFAIGCAIAILFPGMMINLFTRGVHGSWDDPLSEAIMVGIPAVGWFYIIRTLLSLVGRKKEPNQTSEPMPLKRHGSS